VANVIVSWAINVTVVDVETAFGEEAVIVISIGVTVSTIYFNIPVLGTKVQLKFFPVPEALNVTLSPKVQVALSVILFIYARLRS